MKKRLTTKEKLFRRYFLTLRNVREAAALSGLCGRDEAELAALENGALTAGEEESRAGLSEDALAGLRRLAFGSVADAVRLVLTEGEMPPEEAERLDLFNVSEIKRPKGGGMEIKFFDRLKPLERLMEAGGGANGGGAAAFYEALNKGAAALAGR